MRSFFSRLRHNPTALYFSGGALFLVVSIILIVAHVQTIMEASTISVPLVSKIPLLERRLGSLTEQIELTQLHAAVRTGSQQETVEVYALPQDTDIARVIATFEVIRDTLQRQGMLSRMSDIDIGDPQPDETGATVRTLSVDFSVSDEGLKTVMLLVRLAGLLTVGDALTPDEIALLVDRTEKENPSGIIALEQFLSADLLRYSENPKAYEEQVKRSFGNTTFVNAFDNVLRTSLLRDVREILQSDMGEILQNYRLWPMQMMTVQGVSIIPGSARGWQKLSLKARVYSVKD